MSPQSSSAESALLPVKCLLVDDLDENLLAMSAVLRGPGVELLTARSGPEALEILLVEDVALAFLDVQMPDMDGFELAELIRGRERTRDIPLIFVTAGVQDRHRQFRGYESGAVDFLYKPVDPLVLKSKAEVFFRLHRQQRLLESELRERTEALRLNERFAAVLGHDLRSPLSAILTSALVLQRNADPTVRRMAGHIHSSGGRMSRLIEDLLDVTRARSGEGFSLVREPLDLHEVVQRVVQEHRVASPDRVIEVRAEGDLSGHWDDDRLSQLASNLIGNALQHGDPEGAVEVRLYTDRADEVTLAVANAGSVPEELVPRLFEPFRSGVQHHGRSQGLGLGLFIVDQIARSHCGRVQVQSGGGETVFTVVLPRHAPAG